MRILKTTFLGDCLIALLAATSLATSPDAKSTVQKSPRKIGGFFCIDLNPYRNDATFDLYQIGAWTFSGFSQDIWKRHGVPFWYPRGLGDVFVAGSNWAPPTRNVISSVQFGGTARADHQQPGNGAIAYANDDDLATYWYAGDNRPLGKLTIDLQNVQRLTSIRFLGFATGRHAPKDYRAGVILPDGSEKELASVKDEQRMGQWISFDAQGVQAKGIYLDIASTAENDHGPVIHEFQACVASPLPVTKKHTWPSEVVIPLGGLGAEELFVLGNVGQDLDELSKAGATVGRYVIAYESGDEEVIPLVVGQNLADMRYGHFVPEAEPAFMMPDCFSPEAQEAVPLSYHLDEMLPLEPKKQLMKFEHRLAHPGQPLRSLTFQAIDSAVGLYLAAVTIRQSGPRLSALFYDGKMVDPIPEGTPTVAPSVLDALRDTSKTLSLDGEWLYRTDPGNEGVRGQFFTVDHDVSAWKTMPVPSQWYVQGLDYHGVVWFRRDLDVPADFPGLVAELNFGAVDYDARVWVNGQFVGRHTGAYSSCKLDVTSALQKGMKNSIVVRVDSPLDPGFTGRKTLPKGNAMEDIAMPYAEEGCMGGIYRSVRLEGRGDVGIEDAWTQTTLTKDLQQADLNIQFALCPKNPRAEELTLRCALKQADGSQVHTVQAKQKLTAEARTPVELSLKIDQPRLWYPWEQGEPYLYLMEIEVWRGEQLLDRNLSRVGIREIGFDEEKHCVLLNHHRIFLKGFLNDDVHWMSLMDRSGYQQRLQMQKDANVNTIRIVTHQSSPEMYDLCNEMGIMVWQEMPLQWGYSSSAPIRRDILQVTRETMLQCRAHPCVVGYSAWNEGGQADFTDTVVGLMKELDSTRPMSRACGGGDWDVHYYTNLGSNLCRLTPLWSGVRLGFVSEVGSYGIPSPEDMHSMLGPDLFRFDSAEYYWDSFNHYRHQDGPLWLDSPTEADWPKEQIRQYLLAKQPASERWLWQYMKFMFENFRGQRFAPTTAALHCRFDDPLPTAFLGVVSFNGRPRKAYFSSKEALQAVMPILFFDFVGAEDLRVVNEYWYRSWIGCTLKYTLQERDGTIVRHIERKFDLPADSVVSVLTREEVGDVWHLPGFLAEVQVVAPDGAVLSVNHYDLTAEEIRDFVTNVYPVAPVKPFDAIMRQGTEAIAVQGAHRELEAQDTYSERLLELSSGAEGSAAEYAIDIPESGEYLVRVACNSGEVLSSFDLTADGQQAPREHVPFLNMGAGITRRPYSAHNLSWRPGWRVTLPEGTHKLVLQRPKGAPDAVLLLDAICVQPCLWQTASRL